VAATAHNPRTIFFTHASSAGWNETISCPVDPRPYASSVGL
jgi:hypothetical protein